MPPRVDRRDQVVGLQPLAAIGPQARKRDRRAQTPLAGNLDGPAMIA